MRKSLFLLLLLAACPEVFAQTAVYPGAIVTDNQLRVAKNLIQTTLSSSITSTATSLTLASGSGITTNALLAIDTEIFAVCGVSGSVITIGKSSCPNVDGRGFDGSAAATHNAGATVSLFVFAWYINAPNQEIKAIETALGVNLANVLNTNPRAANLVFAGPASGSPAAPTFRGLVSADIPNNAANTSGSAASFSGVLAGDVGGTQGATVVSKIGGLTPGPCAATVDCTNANNLTSGTVNPARLPTPTPTSIGAVKSQTCAAGNFVSVIATDGSVICTVPVGAGNVIGPGAVTSGFLATWGNSNNTLTTGLLVGTSPAANSVVQANSSGQILPGWMPAFTGDATTSAGTVALTLATVNGSPGACGDASHVCAITTNGKGLVTAQTATSITAAAGGTNTQLQVNQSGSLAGLTDFTFGTPHSLVVGASGILDAHSGTMLLPGSLSTGIVTVTTSTGALSSVAAPAGAVVGTTDAQTLTGKSIAGSEINSSTVASTFGGTGADLHLSAGLTRAGNPFTVAELSGDATTSGSNAVTNVKVNGVAYAATPSTNTVPVVTASNTATYQAIPNCGDASHALAFSTGSSAFSCQAITAAAGAVSLDSLLNAGGASTLANGDNAIAWNWTLTTAAKNGFAIGETTAASGAGSILFNVATKSTSTAFPIQITAAGTANGVQMSTAGVLGKIGTGQINADHYAGNAVIAVPNGGTGAATFTVHGVVLGEAASALGITAAGAADTFLQGQGAADPVWSTALATCGDATHALNYSTSTHNFGCQAITATAAAGGSSGQVQWNNTGGLAGITGWTTNGTTTLTMNATGILDLSAATATTQFKLPGALATGLVTVVTSTGAVSSVAAPTGAVVGTSDVQTLTNKSISGTEINSGLVAIANGGTGQSTASTAFNVLSPMTTQGDLIYGDISGVGTRLAGNITTTQKFLCQTGSGSASANPAWCALPSTGATSVVNDTNVTGSITSNVLTLGWAGTLAAGRLNSNVVQAITNDANLTGSIASQNLTLAWAGQLSIARGGTGQSSAANAFNALSPLTTLGDTLYGGASGVGTRLAGNTTTVRKFQTQTGDGVNSAAPAWNAIQLSDLPVGFGNWDGLGNPTGNLLLTMAATHTLFTWGSATGSSDLFKLTDSTGNTGTGRLARFTTASGSGVIPWQADANGIGWKVDGSGAFLSLTANAQFFGGADGALLLSHTSTPGASTVIYSSFSGSATSWNLVLPINGGSADQFLRTDGSGNSSWVNVPASSLSGVVSVPSGGTGVATLANHGLVTGRGASPAAVIAPGATGTALLGQGASSDPSFVSLGTCTGTNAALTFTGSTFGCNTITSGASNIQDVKNTYGAVCDGNSANASTDTAAIQAAMDAVQYTPSGAYTGHVPTVVLLPVGQCVINAPLVFHKPNIVLTGSTASFDSAMRAGSWLVAAPTFDGPFIFMDPACLLFSNASCTSGGSGQSTQVAGRGMALTNFGMDSLAATNNGHFLGRYHIEAYSISDTPLWHDLIMLGHRAGCIKIAPSLMTTSNNSAYDPEQIQIMQFQCLSNGNVPLANAIQITGTNELVLRGGYVSIGFSNFPVTPVGGGTSDSSDFAAIEIDSDQYGNDSQGILLDSIHTTDYAVHVRIRGADILFQQYNGTTCNTHPGCAISPTTHYGPRYIQFINHAFESYNIALVIRDEGSSLTKTASSDITLGRNNRVYFTQGSNPQFAWVDWLHGGEIDNSFREGAEDNSPSAKPLRLGANTSGVMTWVYYDTGYLNALPVIDGGGNNFVQVATGRQAFSQLPRCWSSVCSIPSTDAPRGTQLYCIDCNNATAGSAPTGGTGSGRMLVSNGSSWVGQ